MSLKEYRKKRKRDETPEPFGDGYLDGLGEELKRDVREDAPQAASAPLAFVIHQHAATRMHCDLRIEVDGALQSFALPKGPTLDPDMKHLAVHTEDHPIEYLDFEAVIPEGNYGAGPMIVWDRGRVEPIGDKPLREQIAAGKVDFYLYGFKVRGRFALVRLKGEAKAHLLLKKQDAYVRPGAAIMDEFPESVLSGLRVHELEHKASRAAALAEEAAALADPARTPPTRPSPLRPLKWDVYDAADTELRTAWGDPYWSGLRILATRDGEHLRLVDEAGEDVIAYYPDIARALLSVPAPAFVAEGVIVCVDEAGAPSISRLAQRTAAMLDGDENSANLLYPAQFIAQDLWAACGSALRVEDPFARRMLLAKVFPGMGVCRAPLPFRDANAALRQFAKAHALEGVLLSLGEAKWFASESGGAPRPAPMLPSIAAATTSPGGRAAPGRTPKRVVITNRNKIFWPDLALTKGDLIDYYAAVAPAMLTYLRNRPVILTRYPDGVGKKSFFQWNVPPGKPDYLETFTVVGSESTKRVFLIQDTESLLYVANLGCIPIHLLPYRTHAPSTCDFLTMDFDVKASGLRRAIPILHTLRALLREADLPSFVKTSGQSGVHVLVPLCDAEGNAAPDAAARGLAQLLGHLLVREHMQDATMERIVQARGDKVFIDTGQTGVSRAIVAPLAVRATPQATVSMPIAWDEVTEALDPSVFTLRSAPERMRALGDPMQALLTTPVDLRASLDRLAGVAARRG